MAHSYVKCNTETFGSLPSASYYFVNWEYINLLKVTVLKKEHQCIYCDVQPESWKCAVRKAQQRRLLLDNGSIVMFLLQQEAVNTSLPRQQL
jgi:hypothetical protein